MTQIASGGGEEIKAATEEPAVVIEAGPTQTEIAAIECPAKSGQPTLDEIDFPEELGEISEQDGKLFLNNSEVLASFQSDADCNEVIWIALASSPEWPVFIKGNDGEWAFGAAAWNGELEIVNATEALVLLSFEPLEADTDLASGPQEIEITGYEIFNLSFLPPGKYRLTFTYQAEGFTSGSCSIDFGQNSVFLFTMTSVGVAVFEESFAPSHSDDINILTSELCGN